MEQPDEIFGTWACEAGGGNLQVARVERLRDRSLATWRGLDPRAPFSPGRPDYLLYRGGELIS